MQGWLGGMEQMDRRANLDVSELQVAKGILVTRAPLGILVMLERGDKKETPVLRETTAGQAETVPLGPPES